MIKRLKWNVLHADDDDDPGGLSSSSDESDQELSPAAALQVLMENDPELNPSGNGRALLQSKELQLLAQSQSRKRKRASDEKLDDCSSSDGEHDLTFDLDENDDEPQQTTTPQSNEESAPDMGHGFYEWQECLLCPGKKFYRQQALNEHLQSKKHLKALRKQSGLNQQPQPETGKEEPEAPSAHDADNKQRIEGEKRRSATQAASSGLLTPSRIKSMCKQNSVPLDKSSKVPPVSEAKQDDENNLREEQRQETHAEEARKRAKRKKDAAKRKLKSLKRRKWEKRNKDKAVPKAETLCK
ncbi:zinc finger (C2H2 type) protein [Gracilaria domingensis]|nr:zinc finger (C2H2 type) protein [Gracilaria domingensis]